MRMITAPTQTMLEGARLLVSAAERMLAADPADRDAWERCVDDATAGLSRVVALQALWETLLGARDV